jgi:hypothetical protein
VLKWKLLNLKILTKDIKQEQLKQNYKIIVTWNKEFSVFLWQINTVVDLLAWNRFLVTKEEEQKIVIIPNKQP